MLQIEIEKGSVTKKTFDFIVASFKKNQEENQELLEKILKKTKKERPGTIALDVTKEKLDQIMKSTLFFLFINESEKGRLW